VRVAVEGKAMHGDALGHAHADGADLAFRLGVGSGKPHAGAVLHEDGCQAVAGADVHDRLLESAHVLHHVDGLCKFDDGVTHELTGSVPRDAAAAVHVHHGGT